MSIWKRCGGLSSTSSPTILSHGSRHHLHHRFCLNQEAGPDGLRRPPFQLLGSVVAQPEVLFGSNKALTDGRFPVISGHPISVAWLCILIFNLITVDFMNNATYIIVPACLLM